MISKLCSICQSIGQGEQMLRKDQPHHGSADGLLAAANEGCCICREIIKSPAWKDLDPVARATFSATWYLVPLEKPFAGWFKLSIESSTIMEDDDPSMSENGDAQSFNSPDSPIWGFFLQPASDIEPCLDAAYVPPDRFPDPEMSNLVSSWFSVCSSVHHRCQRASPDFYPTRLIEIAHDEQVRVVLRDDDLFDGGYATLSHCWGQSKRLKLLESNMASLRNWFSVEDLPQSYREAITVCTTLGIRFIWIDSLCIIQDSKTDWAREAVVMKDVYGCSLVNIAAAAAADGSESSFMDRDASLMGPFRLDIAWNGQPSSTMYLMNEASFQEDVESSPLRSRAWVFQEVWLAPKVLYLTKSQLWWECSELMACESYPRGVPAALRQSTSAVIKGQHTDRLDHWNELVEKYSRCKLTFDKDRVVAFAGIEARFRAKSTGDRCVAGIWESHIPAALCWSSVFLRSTYRPTTSYRAPSWSWLSIEGPIDPDRTTDTEEPGSMKLLCELEKLITADTHASTRLLSSAAILQLWGKVMSIGIYDHVITIQRADGSYDLIEGSNDHLESAEERDLAGEWTLAKLDEVSGTGRLQLSYLNEAMISAEAVQRCTIDPETARVVVSMAEGSNPNPGLYALPVKQWTQEDATWSQGLLLRKAEIKDYGPVYQRIGGFTTCGNIVTRRLQEGVECSVTLI